jgi:hypothetical protein
MSAQIPDTMLLSDLLKPTGYDCPEELQGKTFAEATSGSSDLKVQTNKEATITENGTIVIETDEGYDATKKVTATVNVPSSGGSATAYAWKAGNNYSYYDFDTAPADLTEFETHKSIGIGEGMNIDVYSLAGEVEAYAKVGDSSFTADGVTMTRDSSKDFTLWS